MALTRGSRARADAPSTDPPAEADGAGHLSAELSEEASTEYESEDSGPAKQEPRALDRIVASYTCAVPRGGGYRDPPQW